ncbi:hypothetical protein YTPLAS72_23710 [Nitrospira sp.]|nr:hypothetical protein YTPLAS72_23710 [Nitrospira sp.]
MQHGPDLIDVLSRDIGHVINNQPGHNLPLMFPVQSQLLEVESKIVILNNSLKLPPWFYFVAFQINYYNFNWESTPIR